MRLRVRTLGLLATLLLAACSTVPDNIRNAPTDNPSLGAVRETPDRFQSHDVRWGGDILVIENRENFTELTVLARPLSSNGKPSTTDASPGRFIAHIPTFIDPEEYTSGRTVTVRGTVAGTETQNTIANSEIRQARTRCSVLIDIRNKPWGIDSIVFPKLLSCRTVISPEIQDIIINCEIARIG